MKFGYHCKIDWQDEKIQKALQKAKAAYEKGGKHKSVAMEKEFKKYAGFLVTRDTIRKYIKQINQRQGEDKRNDN